MEMKVDVSSHVFLNLAAPEELYWLGVYWSSRKVNRSVASNEPGRILNTVASPDGESICELHGY